MGKYFFILIAFIFFIGILKSRGTNKLIWFFTGHFFFQERIILLEFPTVISFHRFLIFTLLLSVILTRKHLYKDFKQFPLSKPLAFVFLGMLCVGIFDRRHMMAVNIYRIIDDFVQSFLIIFLCYLSFESIKWKKLVKYLLIASIIMSIYGFYNYITKANPYDDFISKSFKTLSTADIYGPMFFERFRINSFVSNPIYYGYLCSILLMIGVYSFYFLKELRTLAIVSIPITFLNIILSNSRTPLITLCVGLFVFILSSLSHNRKITFFVATIILGLGIINVPLIREKIDATIEIFKTSENPIVGSSLDMRSTQLSASYNEFLKSPVFGNGIYYINENLGWAKNPEDRIRDEDFQGFESYVYHLLIEQGSVGIFMNILFFVSTWIYFLKKRSMFKELSGMGLTILAMFLTFIIGTGTVNSWVISMGLEGILIKYLEQSLALPKKQMIHPRRFGL